MKKFLLFLVIFVSVVSLGLTIYFFAAGNEVISIKSAYIVRDVGETIETEGLLEFKNPNEKTTLKYTSSNEEVLSFTDGRFVAKAGGTSQIVINTSNSSYARLVIDVKVCNGTKDYAYVIDTAEELTSIGHSEKYTTDMSYEIGRDIALGANAEGNWIPLDFSGTIDGNGYTISNIVVTDATLGEGNVNAGFVATLAEGGAISNLVIDNITINTTTAQNIGAIAGINEGQLHNVQATGVITSENAETAYVGGVVGISRVHVDPNPDPVDPGEGEGEGEGEAGEQPVTIEVEEIVHVAPVIERCGFTGGIRTIDATNATMIGGVAGRNDNGTISECYYATGNESATLENYEATVGGIVGSNNGAIATADIYDSFFYLASTTEHTNLAVIGGVTYSNINTESIVGNQIYGNYYGTSVGSAEFNPTQTVTLGSANITNRFNHLLTAEEFKNKASFVNSETENHEERTWNFRTVWAMGEKYPVLDGDSKAGSVYTLIIDDIITDNEIFTAQEFYNAIANVGTYTTKTFDVKGMDNGEGQYEIDFTGFEWGDETHPIPEYMFGIENADEEAYITSSTNCVLKNLTFANGTRYQNVGLAQRVQSTVIIQNLSFDGVTFQGEDGNYVGVIAGVNLGAHIENVSILNVSVEFGGFVYGTVCGLNFFSANHAILSATVRGVNAEAVRFVYAGGVTGYTYGNITGTATNYMIVDNIKLCAGVVGGVTAYNGGGTIQYVVANGINFSQARTTENTTVAGGLYSGKKLKLGETVIYNGNIYLGGIAGRNYSGSIENVYANVSFTAESGDNYRVYAGGITGDNFTNIDSAYVYGASTITVSRGYGAFVGGIAGANAGVIVCSVVDGAYLNTDVVLNSNAEALSYEACGVVGGIVGYDARLGEGNDYSIISCASKAREITGFYAGGISAIEKGAIIGSYCGNSEVDGGDVTITGYMVGGVSAFLNGAKVEDSYVFANIIISPSANAYSRASDVVNLNVSAGAGLTVLMMNSASMKGCYAVVIFSESGVSFGSMLYVDSRNCTVTGCIYQNAGNHIAEYGHQVSKDNMKGKNQEGFVEFTQNIGSDDVVATWDRQAESYPVLNGIENDLPSEEIPFETEAGEAEEAEEPAQD